MRRLALAIGSCLLVAACDGELRFSAEPGADASLGAGDSATLDASTADVPRDGADANKPDASHCKVTGCPLVMPKCNEATGACVRCLKEADCSGDGKHCVDNECVECRPPPFEDCDEDVCDPATHRCRKRCGLGYTCSGSTPRCEEQVCRCEAMPTDSCASNPERKHCDALGTKQCVECLRDTDCAEPSEPACYRGNCVECNVDGDCRSGKTCDTYLHLCVDGP